MGFLFRNLSFCQTIKSWITDGHMVQAGYRNTTPPGQINLSPQNWQSLVVHRGVNNSWHIWPNIWLRYDKDSNTTRTKASIPNERRTDQDDNGWRAKHSGGRHGGLGTGTEPLEAWGEVGRGETQINNMTCCISHHMKLYFSGMKCFIRVRAALKKLYLTGDPASLAAVLLNR